MLPMPEEREFMPSQSAGLRVAIAVRRPIELRKFISGLDALRKFYQLHSEQLHAKLPRTSYRRKSEQGPELYLERVNEGSIELFLSAIEAMPAIIAAQPTMVSFFRELKGYVTYFAENWLLSGLTQANEQSIRQTGFINVLAKGIIANVNVSNVNITLHVHGVREDGINIPSSLGKPISENTDRALKSVNEIEREAEEACQRFYWYRIANVKRTSIKYDRGLIPNISNNVLPVEFKYDELKEEMLRHPMTHCFTVDVRVSYNAERPVYYLITKLHEAVPS